MGLFLSSSFCKRGHLFSFVSFFVRLGILFLRPRPTHRWSRRAQGAVKVGRRSDLAAHSAVSRPCLVQPRARGHAYCGRDDDVEGSSLHVSACSAPTNLYAVGSFTSLHHDAVMRIGSEAPRRRPQSTSRHEGHVLTRDTATSNRHRRPLTSVRTGPETVRCTSQRAPFIVRDGG